MNTKRLLVFSISLALLILGPVHAQQNQARARKVIIFGVDGAQRDRIWEGMQQGILPNMKALSAEGVFADIENIWVTDTKSGWAQILTGYEPGTTGVHSNTLYKPIPKGYTIFERLEEFFGPDNFVTAAVIAQGNNVGDVIVAGITGDMMQRDQGKKYQGLTPGPYFYARSSMDFFLNNLVTNDAVGAKALEVLKKYSRRPFLLFLHFNDADFAGHQYGGHSKEYIAGLVSADAWLGKIIQKLKDLGIYDETTLYVVADHGFYKYGKGHREEPHVFVISNDKKIVRSGQLTDITPTILAEFGVDLQTLQPPLQGYPLTQPCAMTRSQK